MKITKLEKLISQICDIKSQKEKVAKEQSYEKQLLQLRDTEKELIYNIYFLLCGDGDFSFTKYDRIIEAE